MFWFFLSCTPSKNVDTYPAVDDNISEFAELEESIRADLSNLGNPNAVFILFQDGEILYSKGWGENNAGEAIDEYTHFRIGSVTKSMTAAAVFANNISLDSPVQDSVPSVDLFKSPNEIAAITMQQLLEHSAGLVDTLGSVEEQSLSEFMEEDFFSEYFVIAPPGEVWNYSNLNYVVAGYALQEIVGTPYHEIMERDIFSPLAMTKTTFDNSLVIEEANWAKGNSQGTEVLADSYDNIAARPAGFAWSNAQDMASFAMFVLEGNSTIMPEEAHEDFLSKRISMGMIADKIQYGNGLMHYEGFSSNAGWHPLNLIYHNGSIPGYGAAMYLLPEHNAGFVSLVGMDGMELPSAVISSLSYFGLPQAEDFPQEAFPNFDFEIYTGVYEDRWNVGEIIVQSTSQGLQVELPKLDQMGVSYNPEWKPYTLHTFTTMIDGYDLLIRFEADENGVMQYIVHRAFVGQRVE